MLTGIEKICEHLPVNFFLFTHHTNTSWKFAPVSFNVLSNISEMMRLCCSINPLLNGDSVALAMTLMFINSHISRNLLFANSPPLSVRSFSADPYICIQQLKMALSCLGGLMVWQLLQKVLLHDQQDELTTFYDKISDPWVHTPEMMMLMLMVIQELV